jgi:CheY-like chemotaxis protein
MGGQLTVDSELGRGSTFAFTGNFARQASGQEKETRRQGDKETVRDEASSRCLRILVAEDNEFNAQLMEQLLGRRGHQVQVAVNGHEALRLADRGGFDLLFLDVHMPGMDGFEVVRALRDRERTRGGHLPVIALTARSRKEDRERCLAAGMDDFLAKPFQATDLWAAIERVISRDEERGTRDEGRGKKSGPLDATVLLSACGGDAGVLEKLCQIFRTRVPDHLKAIQGALKDRDASRLREAAHKLCGMVGAFSTVAGGVASELEDHAALGQFDEAVPLVRRLETMTEAILERLGSLSLTELRSAGRQ